MDNQEFFTMLEADMKMGIGSPLADFANRQEHEQLWSNNPFSDLERIITALKRSRKPEVMDIVRVIRLDYKQESYALLEKIKETCVRCGKSMDEIMKEN